VENINLLRRAKHLLRLYGFFPKKRLGQNFTVDLDIMQRLMSHASLTKDDVVLEVGAGFGFLTQLLSSKCKKVVAVEVDPLPRCIASPDRGLPASEHFAHRTCERAPSESPSNGRPIGD